MQMALQPTGSAFVYAECPCGEWAERTLKDDEAHRAEA